MFGINPIEIQINKHKYEPLHQMRRGNYFAAILQLKSMRECTLLNCYRHENHETNGNGVFARLLFVNNTLTAETEKSSKKSKPINCVIQNTQMKTTFRMNLPYQECMKYKLCGREVYK